MCSFEVTLHLWIIPLLVTVLSLFNNVFTYGVGMIVSLSAWMIYFALT